jgi:hypothetical protein
VTPPVRVVLVTAFFRKISPPSSPDELLEIRLPPAAILPETETADGKLTTKEPEVSVTVI